VQPSFEIIDARRGVIDDSARLAKDLVAREHRQRAARVLEATRHQHREALVGVGELRAQFLAMRNEHHDRLRGRGGANVRHEFEHRRVRLVPDRGDHAYVIGSAGDAPAASTSGASRDPTPGPGEGYYEMQPGDRLYRVAKNHEVELEWLIERNDIVRRPVPAGTRLIVPAR